jgi:hypothetical protein
MECRHFKSHIPDYLERAADPGLLRAMDMHRSSCRECADALEIERFVAAALTETPRMKAPAGLAERILAAAEAETAMVPARKRFTFPKAIFLPVAASVAFIAGGLSYLVHLLPTPVEINAVSVSASGNATSLNDIVYGALAHLYGYIIMFWGRFCDQPVMLPDLHISVPVYFLTFVPMVIAAFTVTAMFFLDAPITTGIHVRSIGN